MKNIFILVILLFFVGCKESEDKTNTKNSTNDQKEVVKTKKKETRFSLIPSSTTNINVKNSITESEAMNIYTYEYLYNGGGVSAGDINNDGLPDLFFTINMGINRLYLNKGNWEFEDISLISNIQAGQDWSTGVTMVDINSDGWLDIYVCRSGKLGEEQRKNNLFINNRNNTFTEKAEEYGLADAGFSTQASFFDYDNDGDLDMYLGNHPAEFHIDMDKHLSRKSNPHDFERDKLYRNDDGKFVDVSKKAGILNYCHTLGLITTDFNNDGWIDIYVSSDYFDQDYYYINNGDGTFTDYSMTYIKHMAKTSMGADAGDINNDGNIDFVALEMMAEDNKRQKTNMASMNPQLFDKTVEKGFGNQFMHNALQLNTGKGKFSEIAYMANIATTDWSWSPLFADFDLDGFQDLFITNGYKRDLLDKDYKKDMRKIMGDKKMSFNELKSYIPQSIVPNYIYKNNGDLTFKKVSNDWGMGQMVNSNGAAYADLDNDGDLDVIVNNLDTEMSVYKNNSLEFGKSNFIKLKFIGPVKNLNGLGTKVYITTKEIEQYQQLTLTHGYQSSCEPILYFGLSDNKVIDKVLIKWMDGKQQVLNNINSNQTLVVNYKDSKIVADIVEKEEFLDLKDITKKSGINFKHTERIYNDYKDQILLPHKLSQNGPGLAVGDIDSNGYDDFYVSGAAGQSGVIYKQNANGKFSISVFPKTDAQYEDMGAIFFDYDSDGDLDLYVVSGSYEKGMIQKPFQDRLYANNGKGGFTKTTGIIPNIESSGSCVIAGDYDNDGDLDLFVGGRVLPDKYPYAPKSFLLKNEGNKFTNVIAKDAPDLEEIGMVTSALWTDYDNDNDLDLIVVGEWMAITIYTNTNGILEKTKFKGLEKSNGWWNSITGADIDNDGDIDYILGNLGLNSKNKASSSRPFEIYCDDFDGSGTYDIALGYYNGESTICYPVRGRQCSSEQVPSIAKKIPSYNLFGNSSIQDVYGEEALRKALHLNVFNFESIVLLNNNGSFEIKALPKIAQISPNYGVVCEDLDGDGCLDLFFVGNQFPVEVETGRYDAHKGLYLKGACNGEFDYVQNNLPNKVEGDAKSLAMIRLSNGKMGLLVGLNNEKLRILEIGNTNSRFVKSVSNSIMVKTPKNGERKMEHYIGSGYLSQNSNYSIEY